MDSPWDENPNQGVSSEIEWSKMSSDFTNVGYREGITSGKEAFLQDGFDAGFADVGAPLGRELGMLRGVASATLAYLTFPASGVGNEMERQSMAVEARDIVSKLSDIRFSDIAPRDLEAEEHARQHLGLEDSEMELNEELMDKRKMENLEDMLSTLTAGAGGGQPQARPNYKNVCELRDRLGALNERIGVQLVIG
ncbi:hypothetical protein BD779DRAFT_1439678 [Infundibulicybe gibba]|nr:hypothetical protein BD779DRAFT_1439678 [Infundibulicybe gibba]